MNLLASEERKSRGQPANLDLARKRLLTLCICQDVSWYLTSKVY